MKYMVTMIAIVCGAFCLGFFVLAGLGHFERATAAQDQKKTGDDPAWECPIAAGVWYPHKGAVPESPMRYYRVRCFPGCHSGSSLGMYPEHPLEGDSPIFPTSTIDGGSSGKKAD